MNMPDNARKAAEMAAPSEEAIAAVIVQWSGARENMEWVRLVHAPTVARHIRELVVAALQASATRLADDPDGQSEAVLREALKGVLAWASARCPCANEKPDPCPLCGATVAGLEGCKSIEATFPRKLLGQVMVALTSPARARGEG